MRRSPIRRGAPLERRTRLEPGAPPERRTRLAPGAPPERRTRLRPVNPERRASRFARNYGEGGKRGEAVRAMACLCAAHGGCARKIDAAHVTARGMGGCNSSARELVPLCRVHHDEQGRRGLADFEAMYGLELAAAAARIAAQLDDDGVLD